MGIQSCMDNSKSNVKLSVCLLTFNHEKYIRQCMDSFFKQEVDFDMEILVGDDCSTDKTVEILESEYGESINLYKRESNVGLCANMYDLFMKARGEYVFLFSGDDYLYGDDVWKRQVDFLENNNDYFSVSARKLHYNQVKQIFIGGGEFMVTIQFWTTFLDRKHLVFMEL